MSVNSEVYNCKMAFARVESIPLNEKEKADYTAKQDKISAVMSKNKKNLDSLDATVKMNHFKLNQEYGEKALIKNSIVYRWYPASDELPLFGHAHFEVEGSQYEASCSFLKNFHIESKRKLQMNMKASFIIEFNYMRRPMS